MSLTNKGKFYTLQRLINEVKARDIYNTLYNPDIKQIELREGYKAAIDETRKVIGVIDKTNIAGIKIISRNIIGDEKIEDIVMLYGWRNENNNHGWILFLYDDNTFDLITQMKYVNKDGDGEINIPRMYDLKQHQDTGHLYGIFLTYENDADTYSDINNQKDHVRDFITLNGNQKQFFTFLEMTNPLNHLPGRELLPLEVIKVIELTNVDNLNYEVDKAVHRIYGLDEDEDGYTIAMLKVRDNSTWNVDIWPLKFSQVIGETELGYNVQNNDTVKYRGRGGTGTPISLPENIERTLGDKDKLNNLDNFDLKFFENDGSDSDGFLWLTTNLNDDEYVWKGNASIEYQIEGSGLRSDDANELALTGDKNKLFIKLKRDNSYNDLEIQNVNYSTNHLTGDLITPIDTITRTYTRQPNQGGLEGTLTGRISEMKGFKQEVKFSINLNVLSQAEKLKNKKISFDINYDLDINDNWFVYLDTHYWYINGNFGFRPDKIIYSSFSFIDEANNNKFKDIKTITIDPSLIGEQTITFENTLEGEDVSFNADKDGEVSFIDSSLVFTPLYGLYCKYERDGDLINVVVGFQLPRYIYVYKQFVGNYRGTPNNRDPNPSLINRDFTDTSSYRAIATSGFYLNTLKINNIDWADGNTKQWIYNIRKNDAANAPNQPTPYPEEVYSVRAPSLLVTPNIRSKTFIQAINVSRETHTHNEFSFRKNNQDANTNSTWERTNYDKTLDKTERFGKIKTLGYNNGSFLYYSVNNQRLYLTNFSNNTQNLMVGYNESVLNPVLNTFSAKSLLLTGIVFNNDNIDEIDVMVNSNNNTIKYIKDTPDLRNNELGVGLGTYNIIQQSSTPVINESGFNISVEAEDSQLLNYRTFDRVNIINSDGESVYEEPLRIKKEVFNPINIDYNFNYNIEIRNGEVKDDVLKIVNDSIFKNTERYEWVLLKGTTEYTLNIEWDNNSLLLSSDNTFNNGDELELVFKGSETKKLLSFIYDDKKHKIDNELKLKIYWEEV